MDTHTHVPWIHTHTHVYNGLYTVLKTQQSMLLNQRLYNMRHETVIINTHTAKQVLNNSKVTGPTLYHVPTCTCT